MDSPKSIIPHGGTVDDATDTSTGRTIDSWMTAEDELQK
jgi:hypothetical protein